MFNAHADNQLENMVKGLIGTTQTQSRKSENRERFNFSQAAQQQSFCTKHLGDTILPDMPL